MSYDGKAVIGIGPLREQFLRDLDRRILLGRTAFEECQIPAGLLRQPAVNDPGKLRKFTRSDGQPIKTNLAMKYPLLSRRERRQMAREGRA